MTKEESIKQLMTISSIGKSIANDLWNIGIRSTDDFLESLRHTALKGRAISESPDSIFLREMNLKILP